MMELLLNPSVAAVTLACIGFTIITGICLWKHGGYAPAARVIGLWSLSGVVCGCTFVIHEVTFIAHERIEEAIAVARNLEKSQELLASLERVADTDVSEPVTVCGPGGECHEISPYVLAMIRRKIDADAGRTQPVVH